jgi:ankyrin repeat protein
VNARRFIGVFFLSAASLFAASNDFFEAIQSNDEQAVATQLKQGAKPNTANPYGITPLWLAATNGSASMVRMLLKAGADPKATLPHGENALMAAARTGEPETIKALLDAGADPNAKESSQGETALMWAAAENHPEAIATLIKGGADPNAHGKKLDLAPMKWMNVGMVDTMLPTGGFTALHYAARQNAQDAARALADNKADLNAQDADGATPIQIAIINLHYDLAAMLIEKGASPNVQDNTGMTAIYALVDMNGFRSDIGRPAQPRHDKLNALDVLKIALAHGGDPNLQQKKAILGRHHGFGDNSLGAGATALMRAIKGNDFDAMKLLLDNGANPNLAMANGQTPVFLIVGTGGGGRGGPAPGPASPGAANSAVNALKMLAEKGADLDAPNKQGATPLIAAARSGSNALVKALLELGANPDLKDAQGKTALDIVTTDGPGKHDDTAAILKEFAARKQ